MNRYYALNRAMRKDALFLFIILFYFILFVIPIFNNKIIAQGTDQVYTHYPNFIVAGSDLRAGGNAAYNPFIFLGTGLNSEGLHSILANPALSFFYFLKPEISLPIYSALLSIIFLLFSSTLLILKKRPNINIFEKNLLILFMTLNGFMNFSLINIPVASGLIGVSLILLAVNFFSGKFYFLKFFLSLTSGYFIFSIGQPAYMFIFALIISIILIFQRNFKKILPLIFGLSISLITMLPRIIALYENIVSNAELNSDSTSKNFNVTGLIHLLPGVIPMSLGVHYSEFLNLTGSHTGFHSMFYIGGVAIYLLANLSTNKNKNWLQLFFIVFGIVLLMTDLLNLYIVQEIFYFIFGPLNHPIIRKVMGFFLIVFGLLFGRYSKFSPLIHQRFFQIYIFLLVASSILIYAANTNSNQTEGELFNIQFLSTITLIIINLVLYRRNLLNYAYKINIGYSIMGCIYIFVEFMQKTKNPASNLTVYIFCLYLISICIIILYFYHLKYKTKLSKYSLILILISYITLLSYNSLYFESRDFYEIVLTQHIGISFVIFSVSYIGQIKFSQNQTPTFLSKKIIVFIFLIELLTINKILTFNGNSNPFPNLQSLYPGIFEPYDNREFTLIDNGESIKLQLQDFRTTNNHLVPMEINGFSSMSAASKVSTVGGSESFVPDNLEAYLRKNYNDELIGSAGIKNDNFSSIVQTRLGIGYIFVDSLNVQFNNKARSRVSFERICTADNFPPSSELCSSEEFTSLKYESSDNQSIKVTLPDHAEGRLHLNDLYSNRWEATVDGEKQDIEIVDNLTMAIHITQDDKLVEFRYRSFESDIIKSAGYAYLLILTLFVYCFARSLKRFFNINYFKKI